MKRVGVYNEEDWHLRSHSNDSIMKVILRLRSSSNEEGWRLRGPSSEEDRRLRRPSAEKERRA